MRERIMIFLAAMSLGLISRLLPARPIHAAYGDAQGVPGHRGQLVCTQGPTAITGVEGATWDWGIAGVDWGGYGHTTKRRTLTLPGPVTISVDAVPWDSGDDFLHDILDAMITNGTAYTFYWYPRGAIAQTQYLYGTFVYDSLTMESSVDEIVRNPFTLVNAGNVYRVGM